MTDLREAVARAIEGCTNAMMDGPTVGDLIASTEWAQDRCDGSADEESMKIIRGAVGLWAADAALRAIEAAGYAVVKKEPTDIMVLAAFDADATAWSCIQSECDDAVIVDVVTAIYRAMLAASPPLAKET